MEGKKRPLQMEGKRNKKGCRHLFHLCSAERVPNDHLNLGAFGFGDLDKIKNFKQEQKYEYHLMETFFCIFLLI